MVAGVRLKICGLTAKAEADYAIGRGADFVAFNVYPKSPRYLPPEKAEALARQISGAGRVVVTVEPTAQELARLAAGGFDFFQVHFRSDLSAGRVADWTRAVGAERLWLAPKLPPGTDVDAALLAQAGTFLLDTFDREKFGGTGRTSDWSKFARHQRAHPEKTWILSGGLGPENISEALRRSEARFIDVNSGVESAPGVKDPAKVEALIAAIVAGAQK